MGRYIWVGCTKSLGRLQCEPPKQRSSGGIDLRRDFQGVSHRFPNFFWGLAETLMILIHSSKMQWCSVEATWHIHSGKIFASSGDEMSLSLETLLQPKTRIEDVSCKYELWMKERCALDRWPTMDWALQSAGPVWSYMQPWWSPLFPIPHLFMHIICIYTYYTYWWVYHVIIFALFSHIHIYIYTLNFTMIIWMCTSHCSVRKAWWRWLSLVKPWWRPMNRRGRIWSHFCVWLLIQRDKGILDLTWRDGICVFFLYWMSNMIRFNSKRS